MLVKKEKIDIQYSSCFEALMRFMVRHNESCQQRTDRITASMKGLAERMITLYLGQINGKLIDSTFDMIPGFHTFNPSLAKDRGCAVRTIINLRRRLVKTGVIKKELLNGNDGIYMWFADELFEHNDLYTSMVNRDMQNLHASTPVLVPTVKKIHPLVFYHELINKNRDVDKWITQEMDLQDERVMNTTEMGSGETEDETEHSTPAHSLLPMVEKFWLRARIKLYPYERFDKERTCLILNFIWATVYEKFQPNRTDKQWKEFHKIALRRIDMVHRWVHRKPKRWVPIAEIYFDPLNNKNGVKKTWEWYLRSSRKMY